MTSYEKSLYKEEFPAYDEVPEPPNRMKQADDPLLLKGQEEEKNDEEDEEVLRLRRRQMEIEEVQNKIGLGLGTKPIVSILYSAVI